ncbi:MAG: CBS domain-containing protein, partial [Methanomassiliicoccaceae archaeon]|nr:CBS domain-containing protein [Methanomassiliicoccaceae archaeon]
LISHEMGKVAKVSRPQSLTIHVTKYNATGAKHKYSMNARLILDDDMIAAKEIGWDLPKTAEDLLKKLVTMVMESKKIKMDEKKKIK